MILDSKNIKYEIVDISEPGKEEDKDFMQTNATSKGNKKFYYELLCQSIDENLVR